MRSSVIPLSIAIAVLLAACAGAAPAAPATPTPLSVVRVHVDPTLAEGVSLEVQALLGEQGLQFESAPAGAADVAITSESAAGGESAMTRYWVPVTGPSALVEDISMSAIADLIAGGATDWSPRPGEALALSLVLPDEPRPPLAQWAPKTTAGVAMPLAAIPEALAADPGAVALVPLDAVDARVRSLAVDGVDVVFAGANGYPLVERLWVASRGDDPRLSELASGLAARLAVPEPKPIVLRATGDIIPARCVYAKHLQYDDLAHAFRALGPWLAEADITVGSLDAAISDVAAPFECVPTFSLLAPAASVDGLALGGFDVVTVATNHVKDCGRAGACGDAAFFDTLANLRDAGIATVGGGVDLAEARAPAIVEVAGVRFAFLGYDEVASYYHAADAVPGTAPLVESYVRQDVAAAAAVADIVVVLPQWGVEYTSDPTLQQQSLARAAAEAGADLVIGNHPHWAQAFEVIDGTFVAYALGNFVFDQDWSIATQQGVVLDVAFHGPKLVGVRLHPIRIVDQHQPTFAGPDEAREILDRIVAANDRLE